MCLLFSKVHTCVFMIFDNNVLYLVVDKRRCMPFRFESYDVAFCCPPWPPVVESLFGSGKSLVN